MAIETHYAKSGDVFIAYQVTGQGPIDLLLAPGFISHLEYAYEEPQFAHWLHELGSFSRLIRFDKRGTGLSDRSVGIPHLDERMDDIRAVLDAVGCKRAALMGVSEGGPMSILFAATYPERVTALILFGSYAHAPTDVPALRGSSDQHFEKMVAETWGTGVTLPQFGPSVASDPHFKDWWARWERLSASPSGVINLRRMNAEIDVRDILRTVRVPTLVMHKRSDCRVQFEAGKRIAAEIPGAQFVELPGVDHLTWVGEGARLAVGETRKFLLGSRSTATIDRVLATVLFTDIVDSTLRASAVGDADWCNLLDTHRTLVRSQLGHFRGVEVKTMGDGFLATFDGPARAIRCAQEIQRDARSLGLSVRAGLHTGEVELSDGDVRGIAVHVAARVSERAGPDQVVVSQTVKDLVAGAGLAFDALGPASLKGLDEPVRLYCALPPN